MYSNPSIWYSGGLHTRIPSGATNSSSEGPNGDTGFVYSGGWSNSGADAADAGFQYSASSNYSYLFLADSQSGYLATDNTPYAATVDLETDFIIGTGGCSSNCSYSASTLSAFAWGTFPGGGFGGRTIALQPPNIGDWTANGTVLKDMVSIGQNANSQPDGVYHDGYSFGTIAIDYCGWNGQGFNYCYRSAPWAYHMEEVVYPSMISITAPFANYDEGVNIVIPSR